MERNTARSMIASSSHQLRRKSVSRFVRLSWLYYFKIVRKFPLKIHTKDTTQTTNNKKKSVIGNQRIHPLCHTALLTQRASRRCWRERGWLRRGSNPRFLACFSPKLLFALNPKGGCFKIRILLSFFYSENCWSFFLQFLYFRERESVCVCTHIYSFQTRAQQTQQQQQQQQRITAFFLRLFLSCDI